MYILLQAVLYVTFLFIDLTGKSITLSTNIKFSIIILCFCYALFLAKSADKGILFCMKTGLLFTLISDLFILVLDIYLYGVLTFILVQQIYGIRITLEESRYADKSRALYPKKTSSRSSELLFSYVIRLVIQTFIAIAICIVLNSMGIVLEKLLVASVFYFICIITNTVRAMSSSFKRPMDINIKLFAIGMVLFLLCDINVGLFNLSGFLNLPEDISNTIYNFSSILMWTFYAPSQVLISLSLSGRLFIKD